MTNDINKDIIAVLMNENQLGIAGIGTFTLHRQAALVTPFEGRVSPPSRKVGFNSNLKIDDGKLSRHLRDTYRLSAEDAQAKIEAFVSSLIGQIDAGNIVHLGDLGSFSRSPGGEIRFNSGKHNFDKSNFGLPEVALTPIVRPERVKAAATTNSSTALPTAVAATVTSIPPITPVSEHAKEDTLAVIWLFLRDNILYIAAGSALLFVLGLWYINKRDNQPRLPDDPRVNTAPIPLPESEDRVNVSPRPEVEEVPFTPPSDPVIEQSEPTVNVAPTPRPEPTKPVEVTPPTDSNTAIIAVGRFGRQANVDKTKRRITDAGYTPYSKRENGLTRVGVQVDYISDAQLERALADIRRRFTQDAFIIKR